MSKLKVQCPIFEYFFMASTIATQNIVSHERIGGTYGLVQHKYAN